MLRLLLLRHGETDWNAEGRLQGQSDTPLNETGIRQAEQAAAYLAAESVDAFYASDLQRAWRTAEIVAREIGMRPEPAPRLGEMGFGVMEGHTWEEAQEKWPDEIAQWLEDRNQPLEGGETIEAFAGRVTAFMDDLRERHSDGTVLIVAHGGSLRELIRLQIGLGPEGRWSLAMDNAALSELHLYSRGAVLQRLNDTHYLNTSASA